MVSVPEKDVEWSISRDGEFSVTWLRKVAMYEEEHPVEMRWSVRNTTGTTTGTARMTTLPHLMLGELYMVNINDLVEKKTFPPWPPPIVFMACKSASISRGAISLRSALSHFDSLWIVK